MLKFLDSIEENSVLMENKGSETDRIIYNQRILLFSSILRLYVANLNKQHSQTYDVIGFFAKQFFIDDFNPMSWVPMRVFLML